MTGNDGKLDCQLVIEMIGRTWDRRFAQYPSQPDGPLKGAGGFWLKPFWLKPFWLKILDQGDC